jgi:hypothetical protein
VGHSQCLLSCQISLPSSTLGVNPFSPILSLYEPEGLLEHPQHLRCKHHFQFVIQALPLNNFIHFSSKQLPKPRLAPSFQQNIGLEKQVLGGKTRGSNSPAASVITSVTISTHFMQHILTLSTTFCNQECTQLNDQTATRHERCPTEFWVSFQKIGSSSKCGE